MAMTSSHMLMDIATVYRINHHMLQVSLPIDYSKTSKTGIRHRMPRRGSESQSWI